MSNCKKWISAFAAVLLVSMPSLAMAQDPTALINSGDTAWMLVSTALVLLMTPGLAFFYAGMVRSKNAVSTLLQNVIALAVIGILWTVVGYSLAFNGGGDYLGDTSGLMLAGVGGTVALAPSIPGLVFVAFQGMFAIITPALMTGAFAERINFKAWLLILVLWSLVVYSPVAHWVWGGGWLADKGVFDFAGGYVVHMTAGFSALVCAILFGKRRDSGSAYDTGMIVLGTALLWFGWFGFNAGSALTSGALAGVAFYNTFIAAAVAMLAWMLVDNLKDGKPTCVGGCIGIVAGLVAITPGAGFVTVQSAMIIGLLAGVICNLVARIVKKGFNIDDTLDVFACHGIGGLTGVICVGLFADSSVNSLIGQGLFNGSAALLKAQLVGAVSVAVWSVVATFVIVKVVGFITPVRTSDADEAAGLDASQHGEKIHNH